MSETYTMNKTYKIARSIKDVLQVRFVNIHPLIMKFNLFGSTSRNNYAELLIYLSSSVIYYIEFDVTGIMAHDVKHTTFDDVKIYSYADPSFITSIIDDIAKIVSTASL